MLNVTKEIYVTKLKNEYSMGKFDRTTIPTINLINYKS